MSDPAWANTPPPDQRNDTPGKQNGLAVAALVMGIFALVLSWLPVVNISSIVLGIAALVTGFLGLRAADNEGAGGRGLAIGGLVTGALGLIFAVLILAGLAFFLVEA